MPQISYYFPTIFPFTYLAGGRLEEIAAKPVFFPTNMAPSSYAVIAAQNAGDIGALVQGFLRACWAEEKNVADDDLDLHLPGKL